MRALGAALGLAVLTAGCASPSERRPEGGGDDRPLPLVIGHAAQNEMASTFEAGGIVRARTSASVASRVLAPVAEVRVRAGDRVRAGQVLVVLDGRELTSRAEAAVASLRSAEEAARAAAANVDAAAAEQKLSAATFTRISGLQSRRSATEQELDQASAAANAADSKLAGARAAAAAAVAARDAARAGSDAARVTASYSVLTAPFDGTVASRLVDPGMMATAGTALLTLEDTSALQLEATLDEARAALVTTGTALDVQFGPNDAGWTPARVTEVARADPASHQFVIKVALPAPSSARTGSFGRVRLSGEPRTVVTIPSSSLVRRGQLAFVFVVDDAARARLRNVSAGRERDGRTEVLAGLAPGEAVVEAPPPELSDGRRIVTAAAPSAAPRPEASR